MLLLAVLYWAAFGAVAYLVTSGEGSRAPAATLSLLRRFQAPAENPLPAEVAGGPAQPDPIDARPEGPRRERPETWRGQPRLAIVIDDIGHNMAMPRRFLALKLPLTYSILPRRAHSREAAGLIKRRGGEFLIHLPMQPFRYPRVSPGKHALLLSYGVATTRRIVKGYFAQLPGAVGASNHMGSAYSYDMEKMGVVQEVVAGGNGIFLNSLTSNSRVPRAIAREQGYAYAERNIFLDNVRREAVVRRQLERALAIARRRGRAIAVGHPYGVTLRAIKARFPKPNASKVKLVRLSRLMRDSSRKKRSGAKGAPEAPPIQHLAEGAVAMPEKNETPPARHLTEDAVARPEPESDQPSR